MDFTVINKIYMATGAIVICVNLVIFVTFISSKPLSKKFQLCFVLAACDIIAGLGTFWTGLGRYFRAQNSRNVNSTTLEDCLKTPWLPMMTIGGQLPALIILLIGFERIIAVHKSVFYHVKFHTKQRLLMVFGATVFVLVDLMTATTERLFLGNITNFVDYSCSSIDTYAPIFNDFHNFVIVFSRTLGFVFSLIAFLSARKKSKQAAGRLKVEMSREAQRINVLLALSGVSMLQATLPTLALWGDDRGLYNLGNNLPNLTIIISTLNSVVNLLAYALFEMEFRVRLFYLCTCKKGIFNNSVTP